MSQLERRGPYRGLSAMLRLGSGPMDLALPSQCLSRVVRIVRW